MPQVPQHGNRGFGAGRGNAGGPIGGHLTHQQHNSHQALGSFGPGFSFPAMDNTNSQHSIGGPLSQSGIMTQVSFSICLCIQSFVGPSKISDLIISYFPLFLLIAQPPVQGLSQTFHDGFSIGGVSQVLILFVMTVCLLFHLPYYLL